MSIARKALLVTGIALALTLTVNDTFGQRRGGGGGGGGYGGRGGGGGMMGGGQQVNPAVQADQQEVNSKKATLDQANSALTAARVKAEAAFHKSDDYQSKQKAVDDADAAKDKARKAVIAKLKTQPDYKTAADKETAADTRLKQLRADSAPRADISEASLQVLNAGKVTSKMENEALNVDTAFTTATTDLTAAIAARKELEDSFKDKLKDDPTIQPLIAKVDDAKTQYDSAVAKMQQDRTGIAPPPAAPKAPPTTSPATKPTTQPGA